MSPYGAGQPFVMSPQVCIRENSPLMKWTRPLSVVIGNLCVEFQKSKELSCNFCLLLFVCLGVLGFFLGGGGTYWFELSDFTKFEVIKQASLTLDP